MTGPTYTIDVHHVTRVEGHGNIRVNVRNGEVEDVRLMISEANRFFESFTRGMRPHEIPWIVGRICGICCVGHQLAATKAVEDAQKIAVSDQTKLLRKLLNDSQFIQSHVLHVYFLAVPDYVGVPSVLPLAKTHPDVVRRALALKKLANDYTAVMGGRMLHPMANTLKGWRKLPDLRELEKIRDRLVAAVPDLQETVGTMTSLSIPPYERETEFVSLKHPDEYALYDGLVYSSDTKTSVPVSEYRNVTNEFTVAHSTTKWSRWHRESYAVGALARVNNNFDQLRPEAKEAAEAMGLKVPCFNPYMNNVAQVVETIHCAFNSVEMIEALLQSGLAEEDISYKPTAGRGFGATEVPRGILFHDYAFDGTGRCVDANAVIPTSQNINNIEQDMRAFVPRMLPDLSRDDITLRLEMLLRAYDPCISCSVHMLDVEFVD
ncbi:MAG: Ni/Fe hydrogenase subunit alpha [Deltaproteobacteria bacterium]|nr:Ni/Fe hydrogenase subunit alpha [Deltaproteobacteria bacterium]